MNEITFQDSGLRDAILRYISGVTNGAINMNVSIANGGSLGTDVTSLVNSSTSIDDNTYDILEALPLDITASKSDEIDITYVPAGNGAGQIATVVYSLLGVAVGTLTLTYDANNKLIHVVRS
jgi:hypothetical protein